MKCILKSLSCTTIIISGRRVLTRALESYLNILNNFLTVWIQNAFLSPQKIKVFQVTKNTSVTLFRVRVRLHVIHGYQLGLESLCIMKSYLS